MATRVVVTPPKVVIKALTGFTEQLVRALVVNAVAELQESPPVGTPVDTGFARANWIPSIGSPFKGLAGTPDNVDQGASAQGVAEVATGWRLTSGTVFIVNNTAYIGLLNEGTSKQTPAGFVQDGIERAVRSVERLAVSAQLLRAA